jgi:hypothetical protein
MPWVARNLDRAVVGTYGGGLEARQMFLIAMTSIPFTRWFPLAEQEPLPQAENPNSLPTWTIQPGQVCA